MLYEELVDKLTIFCNFTGQYHLYYFDKGKQLPYLSCLKPIKNQMLRKTMEPFIKVYRQSTQVTNRRQTLP